VLAGDLLELSSIVDRRAQAIVVKKYFSRLRAVTRLVTCSGNHDLDAPNESGEKVAKWLGQKQNEGVSSDGESFLLDGVLFTVCPWWDGPITRDEVGVQLARAAEDRPARWVWIYHAPPAGTPLCHDGRRTFPDRELAEWIGQHRPELVFCGHIHQSPWATGGSWHARLGDTWVFNAGKQIGKVPPHITVDTEAGTADWFGVYQSEALALA
jgi:Icc-related predicted phosphoesterase